MGGTDLRAAEIRVPFWLICLNGSLLILKKSRGRKKQTRALKI